MLKSIKIHKNELGLLFQDEDLTRVLQPGKYRIWGTNKRVDICNRLTDRFVHEQYHALIMEPLMTAHLETISLADNQRALVWKQGRLSWLLGPGEHAFHKGIPGFKVEVFEIGTEAFEHEFIEAILEHPGSKSFLETHVIESNFKGLLFREGQFIKVLESGRYPYWKGCGRLKITYVDQREQMLDVTGQEIMTSDKVSLRMNMVLGYQVIDTLKAAMEVTDFGQALYREAQLVLRAAVGTRTLDKLLADKDAIGAEIKNALKTRVSELGLSLKSVGVRDIILPGDMRSLLNRVTEAQKEAEANLIRRREETAAARSQANTAKLISDNPLLMKMKELEAIQEIMAGSKSTFFFTSGDVSSQLRDMIMSAESK